MEVLIIGQSTSAHSKHAHHSCTPLRSLSVHAIYRSITPFTPMITYLKTLVIYFNCTQNAPGKQKKHFGQCLKPAAHSRSLEFICKNEPNGLETIYNID